MKGSPRNIGSSHFYHILFDMGKRQVCAHFSSTSAASCQNKNLPCQCQFWVHQASAWFVGISVITLVMNLIYRLRVRTLWLRLWRCMAIFRRRYARILACLFIVALTCFKLSLPIYFTRLYILYWLRKHLWCMWHREVVWWLGKGVSWHALKMTICLLMWHII